MGNRCSGMSVSLVWLMNILMLDWVLLGTAYVPENFRLKGNVNNFQNYLN